MEHTLWLTKMINKLLGPAFAALAELLGLPYDEHLPLGNHIVETWLIMAVLVVLAILARRRLSLVPGKFQQILELIVGAVRGLLADVVGPKGERYVALIGTYALYISISNLLGLVPGCASPTANLNTTLACALIIFVYYHYEGIKEQGVAKYFRHFLGPALVIGPLMLVIEVISHCARVMSLSIRLFGNILGEDIILMSLLNLAPCLSPVLMMCLAVLTSLIQAFVFCLLSCIYLAGAVVMEEH